MTLASRRAARPTNPLMGDFVARPWRRWGGWAATAIMAVVAVVMFALMA